ncbi:MAG: hypothetical protein FJ100_20265 [Deltaproteobacteria bacterium]|nr:hypothetical protein [Deltaproteobacteria bacterium]
MAETSSCETVGPAGCGEDGADPSVCAPQWCAAGRDDAGKPCSAGQPACLPQGDLCPAHEDATQAVACPAGQFPAREGAGCATAGAEVADVNGHLAPAAKGALWPELPPVPADWPDAPLVPAAAPGQTPVPLWCADSAGAARACAASESGCPVGYAPGPASSGQCAALAGPSWVCPPGFDVSGGVGAPQATLSCVPAKSTCPAGGADGFAWSEDLPGTVYVRAGSPTAGATGARSAPFATVTAALGVKPQRIAVAAGTYPEALTLKGAVELVGQCAALVQFQGPPDQPAVHFSASAQGAAVARVTLRGGSTGVLVAVGAKAAVREAWLHKVGQVGAVVQGQFALRDTVVADVEPAADGDLGSGLVAIKAGAITAERVAVERARLTALLASGPGSTIAGSAVSVQSTLPGVTAKEAGSALAAVDGGGIALSQVRVTASTGIQALATGSGSHLALTEAAIAEAAAGGAGMASAAVVATGGASVTLDRVRVAQNAVGGIVAYDAGTKVHLAHVLVAATAPDPATAKLGGGVDIGDGAHLHADGLRVFANRATGLRLWDAATGDVARVLVDHTLPQAADGSLGRAVEVSAGATLLLRRARLANNRGIGLFVVDAASKVRADDLVVDHTGPDDASGLYGTSAAVANGTLRIVRGRLAHGHSHGAAAVMGGQLLLAGVAIHDIAALPQSGQFGLGALAHQGGHATLLGCAIARVRQAGVTAATASSVTLVGTTVAQVEVEAASAAHGVGVWAYPQATATLRAVRVAQSHGAAVATFRGTLDVRAAVLVDTLAASGAAATPGGLVLADGLVAREAEQVAVRDCWVAGNGRAGLFFDGPAVKGATLAHSVATQSVFGLVTQRGAVVARTASWIALNSQQNLAGDAGLSAPEPPQLAPFDVQVADKPKK